jgi:N-ethylmaleimide reductase
MNDVGTLAAAPVEALFRPLQVGRIQVRNRLAFAPCTRQRSDLDGTPNDLNVEYYRQRSGAGLIVSEGIYPDDMGKGYLFSPGLCTEAHVRGWRRVTDAVHAEGGAIFAQIMHVGRLSDPLMLPGGATPGHPPLHGQLPATETALSGPARPEHPRSLRCHRPFQALRPNGGSRRFRRGRDPCRERLSAHAVPHAEHQPPE